MKVLDTSSGINFIFKKLGHRKGISDAVIYLKSHPDDINQLFSEIDLAIEKFNEFTSDPLLVNATHLKTIANVLPSIEDIYNNFDSKYLERFWELMNKFTFIDETWDPSMMTAAIVIASYRTWMLSIHSGWGERNAQVASALEEMLAVEALNGNVTNIFKATKHWILDWKEEGMSEELAKLIEKSIF